MSNLLDADEKAESPTLKIDAKKASLVAALMLAASGAGAHAEAISGDLVAKKPFLRMLLDEAKSKHANPEQYAQYTYCQYNFCSYAQNFSRYGQNFGNYGRNFTNPRIELRRDSSRSFLSRPENPTLPNGRIIPESAAAMLEARRALVN